MFESYVEHHGNDDAHRIRLVLSLGVSLMATLVLASGLWTAQRMGIHRVAAPHADASLLQILEVVVPPPSAPPPAPAVAQAAPDDPIPDVAVPLEPQPDPDPTDPSPRGPVTPCHDCVPGQQRGFPGAMPGKQLDRIAPAIPPVRRPPRDTGARMQPLDVLRARATFAPDPDPRALARTNAALFRRNPGDNRTRFCVDPGGRVVDVRTTRKFPGDPGIDSLCRATVKRWRFTPQVVDGRPRRTCGEVTFHFDFAR